MVSTALLAALERRDAGEEAALASGAMVPEHTRRQLAVFRKKWFTPELQVSEGGAL